VLCCRAARLLFRRWFRPLGELAALGINKARSASVRAKTPCELYRIEQEDLNKAFADAPDVISTMRRKVCVTRSNHIGGLLFWYHWLLDHIIPWVVGLVKL
jgi:hypothetical protein